MRLLEIHLEVASVERALEFYARLFPHARQVGWDDRSAVALVFDDGAALGIWTRGKLGKYKGRAGEHTHYAFQVTLDELEIYRLRLTQLGVEFIDHAWTPPHKSIYFFDPDGHQGEFMTKDWNDIASE